MKKIIHFKIKWAWELAKGRATIPGNYLHAIKSSSLENDGKERHESIIIYLYCTSIL